MPINCTGYQCLPTFHIRNAIFRLQRSRKTSQKFFRRSPKKKKKKKKKVFTKIFQAISTKKRFPKNFSSAPQNFNIPKNRAVLEPRTGQFSRTWGLEAKAKAKDLTFEAKAKDFKICPRGLHLCYFQNLFLMSLQYIVAWQQPVMLYNIKQAGGLKASPMHIWLGLALFSLFKNQ